jgi:hypothetical protein
MRGKIGRKVDVYGDDLLGMMGMGMGNGNGMGNGMGNEIRDGEWDGERKPEQE